MYRLNSSSLAAASWANTRTKIRTFPKHWKKTVLTPEPVASASYHGWRCIMPPDLAQWNVKYSFSGRPMSQMDFLCVCCDTIPGLCHYMSDKASLKMVVMGTVAQAQNVQVFFFFWWDWQLDCHFWGVPVILYNSSVADYMLSVLSCCFDSHTGRTSSNHPYIIFQRSLPVYLQACAAD